MGAGPELYAFGPDLAVGFDSGAERSFSIDLEERTLKHELPGRIRWSPRDDRRIFRQVGGGYAVIDLRDPGAELLVREFADPIRSVRWYAELSDGRVVGWDKSAKRVTVASYLTGELLGHYPGHGRDANVFLLSTDERTLLTVDYANSVRTWRLNL